jgi:nitrite reductase/ring-hydroxylating ferredoxin subunit
MPLGTVSEIDAQGHVLAVANVSGEFYAIDRICSYQGGHLEKGKLKDYVVKCPTHGSEFDVRTGKYLKEYQVSKVGEDLFVEM